MLYELAITPDVFDAETNQTDPEHHFELRELLRELAEYGSIADLDKQGWSAEVSKRIADWPDDKHRDLLKRYLILLKDRHRFISYPKRKQGVPQVDSHWLDLALEMHRLSPFDRIVYGERTNGPWAAKNPAAARVRNLRHSGDWKTPRSASVRLCENDYLPMLARLLRNAKWARIVDPYVSFRSNQLFGVVRLCAEMLGNRRQGRSAGAITIITELNPEEAQNPELALEEWVKKIRWMKNDQDILHKFRIVIWKQDLCPDDLHDRFLLTNQCGVSVPGGFACYTDNTTHKTTWSLLDHDVYRERLADYDPDHRPGLVLGERWVT